MITTKEILVSPEIAREYLTHNKSNRALNKSTVSYYAKQMKNGEWRANGETIKFKSDGTLLDGQHRLNAIIESKVSIVMLVVRGIDDDMAFATIDIGKTRTAGDMFSVANIPSYNNVAASITKFIVLRRNATATAGQGIGKTQTTKTEIWNEYHSSPDLWQQLSRYSQRLRHESIRILNLSDITALSAYLIKERNHSFESVQNFFTSLMTGVDYPNQSIRLLREALLKDKLNRQHFTARYRQNLIARAWNNYVQGKEPKKLISSSTETYLFL